MYADQQNSIKYSQLVNTLFSDQQGRKFHLTKLLGGGSEGGVFLADMIINNQKNSIALKIQNKMRDDEKQFIDKLIQYQSTHENSDSKDFKPSYIIRIYERFVWNNADVTMMEKGEEDLYTYCKQNKKGLIDKQALCKNIMQSIDFLHSLKFFHRDIKPENFIRVGNDFKLCDFGLIKQFDQRLQTYNVGTAMFQAPEIIKDQNAEQESEEYNEKIDMWALGCLFYEILKDEEFFQAKTVQEIHQQIKSITANPQIMKDKISQLKISESWQNVLMRMLDPNAQTRISSQEALSQMNSVSIFPQIKIQSQQQQQKTFPVLPNKGIQGQQQNRAQVQTLQNNTQTIDKQQLNNCTGSKPVAQNVLQTDFLIYKVQVNESNLQKTPIPQQQQPFNTLSTFNPSVNQKIEIEQKNEEPQKNVVVQNQHKEKLEKIEDKKGQEMKDEIQQKIVDENQQQKGDNQLAAIQEETGEESSNINEGKNLIQILQKLSDENNLSLFEKCNPELYKEFVQLLKQVNGCFDKNQNIH